MFQIQWWFEIYYLVFFSRDILLLEAGFLAIIIAPFNLQLLGRRWPVGYPHDGITLWLARWLLFRLMFASGVVKLTSHCPTWWGLSGMWTLVTFSYATPDQGTIYNLISSQHLDIHQISSLVSDNEMNNPVDESSLSFFQCLQHFLWSKHISYHIFLGWIKKKSYPFQNGISPHYLQR